jgi:hypothetical protein
MNNSRETVICCCVQLLDAHQLYAAACCLFFLLSQLEGVEVRSVGNSQVLKETALVEAFNLKAAVEIVMKNNTAAAEALADMPPRWGRSGDTKVVAACVLCLFLQTA